MYKLGCLSGKHMYSSSSRCCVLHRLLSGPVEVVALWLTARMFPGLLEKYKREEGRGEELEEEREENMSKPGWILYMLLPILSSIFSFFCPRRISLLEKAMEILRKRHGTSTAPGSSSFWDIPLWEPRTSSARKNPSPATGVQGRLFEGL
ncbi:hypothetical protein QBC37DRAFT_404567 [Rhypophila decipiens]|uniref:Uncharacterized protein n=1 Tax=Rhypophila decipiens TaxID=261697 RepID=A0AAN6Y308_9PEZI|nr:hypothetical protein QBC37DRAFT_404567 [Rhypophila decipiens]